jgi:hypothetical protein
MLLGMLGFALVWAVELPFGVLDLWWQSRHHLSSVGYVSYLFGGWYSLGGQFVFLCFALAIVMGLARKLGERWWLVAAPAFVGLALSLRLSARTSRRRTAPQRAVAGVATRLEGRRRRACRSMSKRCATSPRSRTPRRWASGRAGASCSGTRLSTVASAAPSSPS